MKELFRTSVSPSGTLQCTVEGDGRSVWMYLVDTATCRIVGDAPVCSIIPLLTLKAFKESYDGVGTPPLVETYTSHEAVIPDIDNSRIGIDWTPDESMVTVSIDSFPRSVIRRGQKRGSSVFTLKSGPWGAPWTK